MNKNGQAKIGEEFRRTRDFEPLVLLKSSSIAARPFRSSCSWNIFRLIRMSSNYLFIVCVFVCVLCADWRLMRIRLGVGRFGNRVRFSTHYHRLLSSPINRYTSFFNKASECAVERRRVVADKCDKCYQTKRSPPNIVHHIQCSREARPPFLPLSFQSRT